MNINTCVDGNMQISNSYKTSTAIAYGDIGEFDQKRHIYLKFKCYLKVLTYECFGHVTCAAVNPAY